jgi:hypothetical protein
LFVIIIYEQSLKFQILYLDHVLNKIILLAFVRKSNNDTYIAYINWC